SKSRRVKRVRFRSSPSWISSSSRPRGEGCRDPIDSGTNRPKAKERPTGLQEGAVKGQADSSIRTEDWVAVCVAQIRYDVRPEDPLGSLGGSGARPVARPHEASKSQPAARASAPELGATV